MTPAARLDRGLAELRLDLPAATRQRLLDYLELIRKWNRVYNLTAVRALDEMVGLHLLDSLAVAPHVDARSILDVGSGAGLPGIPLALALEHARVTLLDASEKKAAFLRQAVIELGLASSSVVCERVENWNPAERFDLVISRAFSSIGEFLGAAGRLCARHGCIAAMKGAAPADEAARLPRGYRLRDVLRLEVPGVPAERHLVRIEPA